MLLHEVSQTALAAAVLTLGLVILLEIHSFTRLRRMVDINLSRVFEQLELLRAESRQLLDAQAQAQAQAALRVAAVAPAKPVLVERQTLERPLAVPPTLERPPVEPTALDFVVAPPIDTNAYQSATALAAHGVKPEEIAARSGLPAGEARLLASLAAARARRDEAAQAAPSAASDAASDVVSGAATGARA
jgi:hypothetical protein